MGDFLLVLSLRSPIVGKITISGKKSPKQNKSFYSSSCSLTAAVSPLMISQANSDGKVEDNFKMGRKKIPKIHSRFLFFKIKCVRMFACVDDSGLAPATISVTDTPASSFSGGRPKLDFLNKRKLWTLKMISTFLCVYSLKYTLLRHSDALFTLVYIITFIKLIL